MDFVYRHERATAAEVQAGIADPPSYSAIRALLRLLEAKGHLRHRVDGPRYVYLPVTPRDAAGRSAIRHLVATFFSGSAEDAVAALIDESTEALDDGALARLESRIERARKEGR
jgi:predicted transcriptional regulator